MGSTELEANLFRATQTEGKLKLDYTVSDRPIKRILRWVKSETDH